MTNNDILRQLRYTLDINDTEMIKIFQLGTKKVTRAQVSNWQKKDDDAYFEKLQDKDFSGFLNGFIISKRGLPENGKQYPPEKSLTNNLIVKKLKIALNLRSDDVTEIYKLAGIAVSEHEFSAFMRNPKQSQYRALKDQLLRNFLFGLQLKYRTKE